MKNTVKYISVLLVAIMLFSCNRDATLQKYFVEKQKDSNFISFDLSSDMFIQNEDLLTQEQKETLKTIKKVNLIALKSDESKKDLIDSESLKIKEILANDKYEQLIRYGSNTKNAALYYTGKENAIDEVVVFGFDEQSGLGLARVLGNNMNPAEVMTLIQSMDKGNLDFSVFNQLEASLK